MTPLTVLTVALYAAALLAFALVASNVPTRPNLVGVGGALLTLALFLSHWR